MAIYVPSDYISEKEYNEFNNDVYISLTTVPDRLNTTLPITINTLLAQTHPIKQIIINVPLKTKKGKKYPTNEWIHQPKYQDKVFINNIPEDYGPASKWLGAIDIIPSDAYIFICDDDIQYRKNVIKVMIKSVIKHPTKQVFTNRNPFTNNLLWGFAGVIVQAKYMKKMVDYPLPSECFYTDDQWALAYFLFHKHKIQRTNLTLLMSFSIQKRAKLKKQKGLNNSSRNRYNDIKSCEKTLKNLKKNNHKTPDLISRFMTTNPVK